ncbi:YhdP family protein [Bowmanella denitrificans]|uniref:YhdP family protein n=1 Tax=Bowmanella denitrificans TaxID=366582 RepID=UPI0015585EE2|nr:YhdP family protein [Bowmanella denitrificans]
MKKAVFYLSYIVRKLWTLSAILLVTLAVLLSLLRYSLPHMDSKKHWLEDYINQEYGTDLKIGSISAAWQGTGPAIVLRDVALNNQLDSPLQLNIRETQIQLDFWGSVTSGSLQSQRFNLDGLTLSLDIPRLESGDAEYPVVDALQALFLEQLQRFSVNDSDVFLANDQERQHIQIQQLSWLNKEQRHQGVGFMRVAELTRNSARFILDLRGGRDNLSGTFHADAKELDISPWLAQINPSQRELASSRLNFSMWAEIRDSQAISLQANLNDSQISFKGEQPLNLKVASANLYAQPDSNGWRFSLQQAELLSNEEDSLIVDLSGHISDKGEYLLRSSNLQLERLRPILSGFINEQDAAWLAQMSPKGELNQLALRLDEQGVAATLAFNNLQLSPTAHLPGINSLQGRLDWRNGYGRLEVAGHDGKLLTDSILDHQLSFDALNANLYFSLAGQGLDLSMPELAFESDVVSFRQALHYQSADNDLALVTQVAGLTVADAKRLFPGELMGKETKAYLDKSLVSGTINAASLLWRGQPANYPFADNSGIFQASVDMQDSEFLFDSDWPPLTGLSMQLLFENEGLWMNSSKGKLRQLNVGQVSAVIPELTEDSILTINLQELADGAAVTDLMLHSELADSVGAALQEVQISGPLQAELELTIPLSGHDVVARGKVGFKDNLVSVNSLALDLQKAQGELTFVNDKIRSDRLQVELLGQPTTLALQGAQRQDGYQTDIQLTGQWNWHQFLLAQHASLEPFVAGVTPWQADLSLNLPEQGYQYEFNLRSDMLDAVSSLPEPFAKGAGVAMPLHLDVSGDEQVSNVRLQLGNKVRFNGLLPHQEMRFSRAHLALGESGFAGMGNGFSISANLPVINVEQWHSTIEALLAGQSSENGLFPVPERIFVNAGNLDVLGLVLNQAEVNFKYSDLAWLATLSAKEGRAELEIGHDWLGRGISIQADYLDLPAWQGSDKPANRDLRQVPPLVLECKRCSYNEYELGQLSLKLSRAEQGMKIERLDVRLPESRLSAMGDWYIGQSNTSTRLTGNMESKDFGAMLKHFKFDAGVRDSGARMDFDLSWQNAPYEFNFASLNGDIKWSLSDGYLSEVSDKGARLFSILSLESLVRKLTLDFRDVFAKGFFYDKMAGTFQLENGRVHTQDTSIDGAAGKMVLAGYTDLNDKHLDYKIGFTPKVTSSLPVILAWMVNPATALAAFALDEVLTSAKVISNIEYSLTGTIDQPVLQELGRDSREVQLPARAQPKQEQPLPPQMPLKETSNG